MKKTTNLIVASLIALAPLASMTQSASSAIRGSAGAVIVKINSDGFRACKSKRNNGTVAYRGKVRGFLIDGSGGGNNSDGNTYFQVTTCFETAKSCKNWAKRIAHTVPNINYVTYKDCRVD